MKSVRDNDYFDGEASVEAWQVLEFTNSECEKENLTALTMSEGLTEGASIRAQDITELTDIGALDGHRRPNGEHFSTVLKKTYNYFLGENLDAGATSAEDVMQDWKNSEPHYKNIMNPNFLKPGVGYNYNDEDSSNLRCHWTQLFADGLRSPESVSAANLRSADLNSVVVKKFIVGTDNADVLENSDYGVTIEALGGNDSISNKGLLVSVAGGEGADTISNSASFVTINPSTGDDSISLAENAKEILIEYSFGDGNDTISGFHPGDTVSISGDEFTPATVGNDVVIAIGNDSITLLDAKNLSMNILGTKSNLLILTDGNDNHTNDIDNATIQALGGNDIIYNNGVEVIIEGGAGNDNIGVGGDNVIVNGGNGNDEIWNLMSSVIINGGAGNDIISLLGGYAYEEYDPDIYDPDDPDYGKVFGNLINYTAGDSNDTIYGFDSYATLSISGGEYVLSTVCTDVILTVGEDSITLVDATTRSEPVNILGTGTGNKFINLTDNNNIIENTLDAVTIAGLGGYDSIKNWGALVSINGAADNDTLVNLSNADSVTIEGGSRNDKIYNYANNVTVIGGKDNDAIYNNYGYDDDEGSNVVFQYNIGDGFDTIYGFKENSTLRIGDGMDTFSAWINGDDIIIKVGTGEVRLYNATSLSSPVDNIEGIWQTEEYKENIIELTENKATYDNTLEGASILAFGGDNSITNTANNAAIDCYSGNNSVSNAGNNVRVIFDTGNDSISNTGNNVIITNIGGHNIIENSGSNVSIAGGSDDDQISLLGGSKNNFIEYTAGEGNDTVWEFYLTDELRIWDGEYTRYIVGNDLVFGVGENSITLADAASLSSYRPYGTGTISKFIELTDDDDYFINQNEQLVTNVYGGRQPIVGYIGSGATINAKGGNDKIDNHNTFVSISGGAGNDDINNSFFGDNVTIYGDEGDDTIRSDGNNVSISGGDGNDNIDNRGHGSNYCNNVTINGDAGDDYIFNRGSNSSIDSGDGNDKINNRGSEVTINSGSGDDDISNNGENVSIDAGEGDDLIDSNGSNVTIMGGAGNDDISLSIYSTNNLIRYNIGDGNDTIWGLNENSSLQIGDGTATYSTVAGGDDIIVKVGNNSITLKNFRDKPEHIIIGESGTSGGTGNSGGNGGNSSSGSGGTSGTSSGNGGGNTSGGTSSSEGNTGAASGGQSASGSSGTATSSDSSGSSGNGSSSTTSAQKIQTTINLAATQNLPINNFPSDATTNPEVLDAQLWGEDFISETLIGGEGKDIFIGGKTQGAKTFLNVSAEDEIHLTNVTLNDIIDIEKSADIITISLDNGNIFTIQSSDTVSGAVVLADSTWHFRHTT